MVFDNPLVPEEYDSMEAYLEDQADKHDIDISSPNEEMCELCGYRKSNNCGVLVVNNRAYPNTPLCNECYIPLEDITLPKDVGRKTVKRLNRNSSHAN